MRGELSRGQIAVYAALGVILVLLGARAIRGAEATGSEAVAGDRGGADGDAGLIAEAPINGPGGGELLVHVTGAVRKPGVYRFPTGARVGDAIKRAGGAGRDAVTEAINLAAPLADGQQVVVPGREPGAPAGAASAGDGTSAIGTGTSEAEQPISLSSATAADLETISGIGPVTAANIIAFRDEQGAIGAIEELDAVPGIGPATLAVLSERLQP